MAENKKSFLLYADLIHTFEELTDDEAGQLIKLIFAYVNDQNPSCDNRLIKIAFEPIKRQLKRDLKEWDLTVLDRSNNGKLGNIKRWHHDLYVRIVSEEITLEQAIAIAHDRKLSPPDSPQSTPIANIAVTVTDTVNDTVNVNVNDIRENTGPPASLKNSNLYRQPNIPTFEKVHELFIMQGGTKEMAEKFYQKHEGTGWFINGSPIVKVESLIANYRMSWQNNNGSNQVASNGRKNANSYI